MTVKRVGIVGSGIMGSGIAEVAAKTGHEVVLRSRKQETADSMVAGLEKSLAKQVERGKLDATERDQIASRVTATHDLHALHDCDLVIESVVEDLDVKKALFIDLDLVGLDTSLSILDALYDEFRDPNYAAMPTLRRMVAAGQLGRKSKKGFYDY